jgi:hypothetical protein
MNRRHMTGDHHGQTARRATLLARAMDEILGTHNHNQRRPHRSLNSAAPLKPLPEPVDLKQYHVPRHARISGMINEYRLVA